MTYARLNSLKQLLPQASRRHSLRRLLMSYLGVVWLVILLFIAASLVSFVYRTEVAAWRGRQGEAARNAAHTVAAFIQRADDSLAMVALLGRDELLAEPQIMHQVLRQNPALQEIVYLDANGVVIANASADQPLLANLFTIPQSQWFSRAKAGQHYSTSIQISSQNEPYLIIALPAPEGRVVAARLHMNLLWEVVADIRFGATGRAYVVADNGQIIAHTNPEVVLANTYIGELAALLAASQSSNGEWYGEYVDLQGEDVVGVAAAVPGTRWVVITELPQREAFATSRTAFILVGGSMFLLMAIMMWISARYLERLIFGPMKALRDGSQRIGGGDLGHRIGLVSQDEVGQVAIAFDEMAANLQERNDQLAARTAALADEVAERKRAEESLQERTLQQELLLDSARQLTASLDRMEVLSRIAASAQRILGANDCIIYLLEEDGHTLTPVVAIDPAYESELLAMKLDVDSSFTGQAIKARRALIFNDALTQPLGTQISGTPEEEDECAIVAPFMVEDRILGAMCLHQYGTPFTAADLTLVDTFAVYAAAALRNAQTHQALQYEVDERKKAEEALRRQNQFLSALYETTLALMNRLEVGSVLEQIVAHAGQLLGTPDGYVYLEGPSPGEIEVGVGVGIYSRRIGYRMKVGEGLAGQVWQSGQALVVDDYDTWGGRSAGYPYHDAHAVIGVPLKAGSQVVGVLGMSYADVSRRFGEEQVELLDRFAQLASVALDNARLYTAAQQELAERKQAQEALRQLNQELEMRVQERTAQLARANQELQKEIAGHKAAEEKLLLIAEQQALLYQVLRAISGQLELDAVARSAVDAIARLTGWPHVCFSLPNEGGTHWVVRAAGGELAAEVGLTYPISQGVIGRVFGTARTQIVPDVRTDPNYKGENPVLLSELAIPIKQGERVLAVLNLESDRPAAFGAEALQVGESLAEAIALALENARLFQTAQVELAERQRAEAALRESEERYRLHFENVSDVVYSIDRELRVLSVSPSIARHLGYTPQELIGRPIQELGLVTPDCLEAAFRDILRALEGEHIESAVYTFIARDGRRMIGEVSGAPLLRDGQVIACVSVVRDITERVRAEEQIKASLHEKEVLLKEIHHRVKNNLQIISSLLNLQSSYTQDAQALEIIKDSQHRVRSMALVHEKLYRSSNLAQIDFAEYIRDLASFLFHAYGASAQNVTLKIRAEDILLDVDNAIPCGLILNELLSNTLKHAFRPGGDRPLQDNEIRVDLHYNHDHQLTLVVADNGIGFPNALDFRNTTSLGLQLVNMLVNQLNGALELDRNEGTRFTITFATMGEEN